MKRGWIPIMGVCLVLSFSACKQLLPYQDTSLTAEQRAEDLLPRLTLEEKVSLMQNASPAIPRLGIKEYEWWNEALHGVGRAGLATVFPSLSVWELLLMIHYYMRCSMPLPMRLA